MRGPKNVCPNRGQRAHSHVPASGITWRLVSVASVSVLHPLLCAPLSSPPGLGAVSHCSGTCRLGSRARTAGCGSRPPPFAHGTCCSSLPLFPPAGNPPAAALGERKRGPAGAPGLEAKAVRGERRLAAPPAALGAQGASPSSLQEAHPGEEARGGVLQPAALGAVGLQHVRGRAPRVPRRSCAVQAGASCTRLHRAAWAPGRGRRTPRVRVRVCVCVRVQVRVLVRPRPWVARSLLLRPRGPRALRPPPQKRGDSAGGAAEGRAGRCFLFARRSPRIHSPRPTSDFFVGGVFYWHYSPDHYLHVFDPVL